MLRHSLWASLLVGEAKQKVLKVYEGGDVHEIMITLYQDQPGGAGMSPEQASTAEPAGWSVSIAYKVSPDTVIFERSFPTDKEAQDVFSDVVTSAAGVESLIRQEKFEEAAQATTDFLQKMKSNTSEVPTEVNT